MTTAPQSTATSIRKTAEPSTVYVLPEPLVRRWYVMQTKNPSEEMELMQAIYNRDKTSGDASRFEVFAPKMNVVRSRKDQVRRGSRSVFSNLLFVQARRDDLHHYKLNRPGLRFYSVRNVGGQLQYLYVPDRQMHDFMQIATAAEREVRYYTMQEGIFRKGDIVRIIGGVKVEEGGESRLLDGVVGTVEKAGRNSVVVHVTLDGIGTIETWEIHPKYIEYIQFADSKDSHSLAYEELEAFQRRGMTALRHLAAGHTDDADQAACQIFLRRMSNAKTVTSLMQHKLNLSLLICAAVTDEDNQKQELLRRCTEALPRVTASQLKAYTLLAVYVITQDKTALLQAEDLVKGWQSGQKATPRQQELIELFNSINTQL